MAKRGRKKKKQQVNINVVVAVMIIASILLAVLIYTNSGFLGEHLSPFLGGIMGYIKYFYIGNIYCIPRRNLVV